MKREPTDEKCFAMVGGRCTALKDRHVTCEIGCSWACPFYKTASEKAASEALAQARCSRMGIPYGDEYIKLEGTQWTK